MTVQKQILTLIRSLQEKHGFACLFVSHDLGAVEQVADRVLVMDDGRIVEQGTRDDIFDRAGHPVTRRLLGAMPALQPEGDGFRLMRRQFAGA
jgi:peptide/nickel transport system ATP-binding protein